jgi:hypothetical protein
MILNAYEQGQKDELAAWSNAYHAISIDLVNAIATERAKQAASQGEKDAGGEPTDDAPSHRT